MSWLYVHFNNLIWFTADRYILLLMIEAYSGSTNWCSGFYPSGFGVPDLVFQVLVFRLWYSVSGFYRSRLGVPVFRFPLFRRSWFYCLPFFRDVNKTSHWAAANVIVGSILSDVSILEGHRGTLEIAIA